jgi:hypothetical protein
MAATSISPRRDFYSLPLLAESTLGFQPHFAEEQCICRTHRTDFADETESADDHAAKTFAGSWAGILSTEENLKE